MPSVQSALQLTSLAIVINVLLSAIKVSAGVYGHSYALLADGIESAVDILSSLMIWVALRFSLQPADRDHPFGHGKAESLAAFVTALLLFAVAALIATRSVGEILRPHRVPEWFTLPILAGVILLKEVLFRKILSTGENLHSGALKNEAWHHRSDAITSGAAFIGISIAVIGGPRFGSADSWAALVTCGIIVGNAIFLLGPALNEVLDAAVPEETLDEIRRLALAVPGVLAIEKCRVRKSGLNYHMDIHVQVDGDMTVHASHRIAHLVKDHLRESRFEIEDVVVHVEPHASPPLVDS